MMLGASAVNFISGPAAMALAGFKIQTMKAAAAQSAAAAADAAIALLLIELKEFFMQSSYCLDKCSRFLRNRGAKTMFVSVFQSPGSQIGSDGQDHIRLSANKRI
jgi:hypothetical protein